jgi:hypothetical protein
MDISVVQTIVVRISQYGFRRWALKSVHSPIEEVTSHQRIGHPHSGRVGAHSSTTVSPTATLAVYRVSA